MRPTMGEEGIISNLPLEPRTPSSRNLRRAMGAAALRRNPIIFNHVPVALDEGLFALRTTGILPFPNHAREISGIDVTKSSLPPDFDGTQQIVRARIARAGHLVVLVEGRDMPWDIPRNGSQKLRQPPQLINRIVKTRNEQRDDLQPQPHGVNEADAIENRSDASTQLVIVPVIKALEVHLVEVNPGTQILEHLRRPVPVRNKAGEKAGRFGFLENSNGPFAGNQRLVVGAYQDFGALIECLAHQALRRRLQRRRNRFGIAQRLRGNPILTVRAVQIASQHAEAVGQRSGVSMKKWLLLDGIALRPA